MLTWFKQLSPEQKVSTIGLAMIGIYLLFLAVTGQIHRIQLSERGVYQAARIVHIGSSKSGLHYYIEYTFQGKIYKGNFKPDFGYQPRKEGAFTFVKVLPDNPAVHQYLDLGPVPQCILAHPLPDRGWREIPSCAE